MVHLLVAYSHMQINVNVIDANSHMHMVVITLFHKTGKFPLSN